MIFVTPAADADCKQPHVYRYSFEANTWETRDKFAWKAVENEDAPTKERTNGDANPPAPVGPNELKPKPLKPTPDPKASQPASPTPVQKK